MQRGCHGESYVHEGTGLRFPESIGGLAYRGVRTYGNEQSGLSVEYKSERSSLSIYLYTGGYSNIPEGPISPEVERQFVGASDALAKIDKWMLIEDVENKTGIASVALDCGTVEFQQATFHVTHDSYREYVSYLLVSGARGHIIKIRLSLPLIREDSWLEETYASVISNVAAILLQTEPGKE